MCDCACLCVHASRFCVCVCLCVYVCVCQVVCECLCVMVVHMCVHACVCVCVFLCSVGGAIRLSLLQGMLATGRTVHIVLSAIRHSFESYHGIAGFPKAPHYQQIKYNKAHVFLM